MENKLVKTLHMELGGRICRIDSMIKVLEIAAAQGGTIHASLIADYCDVLSSLVSELFTEVDGLTVKFPPG